MREINYLIFPAETDYLDYRTKVTDDKKHIKLYLEAGKVGDVSDGYHTFNELYEFRLLYNAALFNEWAKQGLYDVHKSLHHSDGEACFGGGWFVVTAELPTGQISNHYKDKYYDLFHFAERKRANEWDGHTPGDVAERLTSFIKGQ